ncbi:hypothetical protein ACEWY4_002951 [Coilia grayii]|uniref:Protein kinase domain-containing protein n=1 Tax=Coilia grayii TaxID=363190 RepID=A0ABD1KPX2_9TELE
MAVTGTRRILNSTMPFTQKGSLDKSFYVDPPASEPDFQLGAKVGKQPGMDPYSFLAKVITHGTAEQVGSESFSTAKPSGLFIAQAQCESQESQEFSPTYCSHSYIRHIPRPSPPRHSHLAPAEAPVAAAAPVEAPQPAGKRRRRRKHRRRRRSRRAEQEQHQEEEEEEGGGRGGGGVRRQRAHTGVPEQETGEIATLLHLSHPSVLSEQGVLSECSTTSNSNSCSSSSSESLWVQETGSWEALSPSRHCRPFVRQQSLDAGPGAPDSVVKLVVLGCRNVVTNEDKRDGMEYITPFVEAVLRDYKEQEPDNINEGLLFHEELNPMDYEYREGREYSSSLIKSGSYGDVCHIRDKSTGFECAAKKVPLERFKSVEVGAWSCLHPLPNVVELFGAVREGPNIILFMELKSGSVGQLLEQRGRLPEDLALHYFSQVLGALEHLHHRQILHLDIKADNVLLSEDGKNTFLCDFGHSEKLNTRGECIRVNTEMKGTETHMAPEVVRAERCGTKADVWSSSCMLLHMLTGCHPWTRLYSRPLYLTIANEPPPLREIPPDCSPLTADILKAGLQKQPIKRASATELRARATQALTTVGGLTSPVKGPYVKPLKKLDRHSPVTSDATVPTPAPHPTPPVPSAGLSPEPGLKKAHGRGKICRQQEEQGEEEREEEEEEEGCERSPKVNMTATTASERELRKLERDFYLSSLSQPHSAELQEQLLSCLSSEGPSHLDLWDKKDSGRWSLSPGEDLSSGVFSSNSQSESPSFSMEWLGSPHRFGGVDVCVKDFSGRCIRIREKRKVSVGHIARGISEQISEPVFSLQSMDGCALSHDHEVLESGLRLHCVRAPDCKHPPGLGHTLSCRQSWGWRIKDGHLETKY